MAAQPISASYTIGAYVNCNCNLVIQTTSGSQTGTNQVLFWSPDSWTTIYEDSTAPAIGIWTETINQGGVWNIQAYDAPNYSHMASYVANDIVWYNGVLYYTTSDGAGIPGTPGCHWTIMPSTPAAAWAIFQLAISDTGNNVNWTIASVNASCNAMVVTKNDCYNYTVCNNTLATEFFSVTDLSGVVNTDVTFGDTNATPVYDITGLILLGWSLPVGTCTAMILPKEGVYVSIMIVTLD